MIKIILADDSLLTRMVLRDIFAADPDLSVVAEVGNGLQAVEQTCVLKPDLVVMDIVMPVMDGLAATAEIMARCPTPILVLSASVDPNDSRNAFNAIRLGALDVMEKPSGILSEGFGDLASALIEKVKTLCRVRVMHHFRRPRPVYQDVPLVKEGGRRILAVGASTGGPKVVMGLMKALKLETGARVMITQHIAQGFAPGFAEWLDGESAFRVRLAEHGDWLEPGLALVAPSDRHLELRGERVFLSEAALVNCCRPSVDVMFHSLVSAGLAPSVVAVLLTGMGQDGADGMRALKAAGADTLAQDEESCTVFGMPRAAIALGAARQVLSAQQLPDAINRLFVKG